MPIMLRLGLLLCLLLFDGKQIHIFVQATGPAVDINVNSQSMQSHQQTVKIQHVSASVQTQQSAHSADTQQVGHSGQPPQHQSVRSDSDTKKMDWTSSDDDDSDEADHDDDDDDDDEDDEHDEEMFPTIHVGIDANNHLLFSAIDPRHQLPEEYPVGTSLDIETSLLELGEEVRLFDTHSKHPPVPLVSKKESTPPYSDQATDHGDEQHEFHVRLLYPGDFCLRLRPLLSVGRANPVNTDSYCFRVLPTKLFVQRQSQQTVVIENADKKTSMQIKKEIIEALHIHSVPKSTKRRMSAAIDDSFEGVESNSNTGSDTASDVDSDDGSDATSTQASDVASQPDAGGSDASSSEGSDVASQPDSEFEEDPTTEGAQPTGDEAASQTQEPPQGAQTAAFQQANQQGPLQQAQPTGFQQATQVQGPPQGAVPVSVDPATQSRIDQTTQTAPHGASAGAVPPSPHTPIMIGINLAFESLGILINELTLQKLLFLIQHITSAVVAELNENDVIITLPVSNKLASYKMATVSERVAVIIDQYRQQRAELHNCYELQYSSRSDYTFCGKIILDIGDKKHHDDGSLLYDVPAKTLVGISDYMISIGPSNSVALDSVAVTVGKAANHGTKYICLQQVASIAVVGYDTLGKMATDIADCMLHAMGISTTPLNIDLVVHSGKVSATDTTTQTAEPGLIEFELARKGETCCTIAIAKSSENYKMYPDFFQEANPNVRQISLVHGDAVTLTLASDISADNLSKPEDQKIIKDTVFYVDIIDVLNSHEAQLERHPQLQAFHDLLYSPGESVAIPNGLWNLCVSWTAISVSDGKKKAEQVHKCSDQLYLNANWLLNDDQKELLQKFGTESDGNKNDQSQFLQTQLVHLQNLLSEIYEFRNELSENTEDEQSLFEKLFQERLKARHYFEHLQRLEKAYQTMLDEGGHNAVQHDYFRRQQRILSTELKRFERDEKRYGQKLMAFKSGVLDTGETRKQTLETQIYGAQAQIKRIDRNIAQQEKMLNELELQYKSLKVTADGVTETTAANSA